MNYKVSYRIVSQKEFNTVKRKNVEEFSKLWPRYYSADFQSDAMKT